MRKRIVLAAAAAGLVALTVTAPPALADPSPPGSRLLVGVGSGTTEDVMNDFANGRAAPPFAGIPALGSYNTLPPFGLITTKIPVPGSNCTFPRPFDSDDGVEGLDGARRSTQGLRPCVDFARSSLNSATRFPGSGLTYVPFAVDGLTIATRNDALISSTFMPVQLRLVYTCAPGTTASFRPLLPARTSEVRSAFLGFIDVSEAEIAAATCVSDRIPGTTVPLTENVGTVRNDPRQLVPYSIAQYSTQQSGAMSDVSGSVKARRINGILSNINDPLFPFRHLVFNVIPTQFASAADPDYGPAFSPTGTICSNPAVIRANGFAPIAAGDPLLPASSPGCGDLTGIRSTGPGPVTVRPSL